MNANDEPNVLRVARELFQLRHPALSWGEQTPETSAAFLRVAEFCVEHGLTLDKEDK